MKHVLSLSILMIFSALAGSVALAQQQQQSQQQQQPSLGSCQSCVAEQRQRQCARYQELLPATQEILDDIKYAHSFIPRRIRVTTELQAGQRVTHMIPRTDDICSARELEVFCERPLPGSFQCQQQQQKGMIVEVLCTGDFLVIRAELIKCN